MIFLVNSLVSLVSWLTFSISDTLALLLSITCVLVLGIAFILFERSYIQISCGARVQLYC